MSDEQKRIGVLENQMSNIGGAVVHMDKKLDDITTALSSLVRIEERQIASGEKLAEVQAAGKDNELRIRELEHSMPQELNLRLSVIETALPALVESRKWVVIGLMSGLGMIGASVLHLVIK